MSKWVGMLVLAGMTGWMLAGCTADFFGEPNDTEHAMEQSRANRPPPTPDQMPPGLGADLPAAPATQPAANR